MLKAIFLTFLFSEISIIFLFSSQEVLKGSSIYSALNAPLPPQKNPQNESAKKSKYSCVAWIETTYENSRLQIKAFYLNNILEDEVVSYKLKVQKSGKSGTANVSQSGTLIVQAHEKKCLSTVTLGVSFEDRYHIKLEVHKGGKLMAEDEITFSGPGLEKI